MVLLYITCYEIRKSVKVFLRVTNKTQTRVNNTLEYLDVLFNDDIMISGLFVRVNTIVNQNNMARILLFKPNIEYKMKIVSVDFYINFIMKTQRNYLFIIREYLFSLFKNFIVNPHSSEKNERKVLFNLVVL